MYNTAKAKRLWKNFIETLKTVYRIMLVYFVITDEILGNVIQWCFVNDTKIATLKIQTLGFN